jgi:hypothetical protein
MLKKCPKCDGELDFSLSEINIIPDTNPQKASLDGICRDCFSCVSINFIENGYDIIEETDSFW